MIFSTLLRLHNSAVYLNDLWSINDRLTAGGGETFPRIVFKWMELQAQRQWKMQSVGIWGKMWVEESYKIRLSWFIKITKMTECNLKWIFHIQRGKRSWLILSPWRWLQEVESQWEYICAAYLKEISLAKT